MTRPILAFLILTLACIVPASALEYSNDRGYSLPDCASGFTRTMPHYCRANAPAATAALSSNGLCTQEGLLAAFSLPETAKSANIFFFWILYGSNASGATRTGTISVYSDDTGNCTTLHSTYNIAIREFAAQAGEIARMTSHIIVPVGVGAANLNYIHSFSAGASSLLQVGVNGYYD